MKTYKHKEALGLRLLKNNGFKVNCWDDTGIKVAGKTYKLTSYGDLRGRATSYVIFENLKTSDSIEIHYNLLKENATTRTNNIFQFVEMW